ncbi:hypothetical protein H4217_007830 [Coemansia sp. RSA 1939]|nr:hypothetical protein H4217_007830 [Coemansia sp. RSA 1939]
MTIEQYDIRSPAAADTKADNNSPTLASSATGTPMNKSNSVIQSCGLNIGDPTPSRNNVQYEESKITRENVKAFIRYGQLGKTLRAGCGKGPGNISSFKKLVKVLGLETQYQKFASQTTKFFEEWSDKAPAIHRGQVITGNEKKYSTKLTETALFGAFQNYLQTIQSDMERLPREFTEERAVCFFGNHETSPMGDVEIKPDGVLFYAHTPTSMVDMVHIIFEAKVSPGANNVSEVLGQIGVYAETVWKAQFTRKFVPVFLLHGPNLTLYIFSRGYPAVIPLGSIFHTTDRTNEVNVGRLVRTLQNVCFLLLQPSDKFGHIVDVSKNKATYLSFGGTRRNATVAVAASNTPRVVKINNTICQQTDVYRRVGYICDIKFEDKKAVLKLSWTPVSRLPEGAVYDVLRLNGVEGIPEIYSSGIICADFLGNRLEYIIMEHCGDSLTTYFEGKHKKDAWLPVENSRNLTNIVRDVSACLIQANTAGVLHRDVSMGNITVRGDKVFVIDWGYARFIDRSISDDVRSHINDTWGIDVNSHALTEKEQDPMTGTTCFMSIRVLAAAKTRSLWDDIESLFYVVLGCLFAGFKGGFNSGEAPGFEHSSNKKSALAKASGVSLNSYASVFGADNVPQEFLDLANKLRTILFYRYGRCIANDLLDKNEDLRDGKDWLECYKVLLGDEKNRYVLDWGETHEDRAKQNVAKAKLEAKAEAAAAAEAEAAEAEAAAASENTAESTIAQAASSIVKSKFHAVSSEILRLQCILGAASGTVAPLGTNICETLDKHIQDLIDNDIMPLVNKKDEYASHLYSKLLAMERLSKDISRQASERRSNLPSTSYITDRMGSLQADSGPSCTSVTSSKRSFDDLEYTDGDIAAAEAQTPTKRPNTRSRSRGNTNARRK